MKMKTKQLKTWAEFQSFCKKRSPIRLGVFDNVPMATIYLTAYKEHSNVVGVFNIFYKDMHNFFPKDHLAKITALQGEINTLLRKWSFCVENEMNAKVPTA